MTDRPPVPPDEEQTAPDLEPRRVDVATPDDPDALVPGRWLGRRYVLEEHVATGATADVWRGFDAELQRTVAIKVLRGGTGTAGPTARFRQEAVTAARLPHPGIVSVFDAGEDGRHAWVALEHVDGPDLLALLRRHPRGLPDTTAAALVEQAAVALAVAHRAGVVHRDIKPANLLITRAGVVKVSDFGIATTTGSAIPVVDGDPVGTAAYAAPEQLTGGVPADPRIDVFALGVVLFEALTGRAAFPGGTDVGRDAALHPRHVRSDVPRQLDALVARATAPDPEQRFRDGAHVASALRALVPVDPHQLAAAAVSPLVADQRPTQDVSGDGHGTTEASPPSEPVSLPRRTRLRWVALLAAVLVAVAGATAVVVGGGGDDGEPQDVAADAGVPVRDVRLYDPYVGDDGSDRQLLEVVDGDPGTAWTTPSYPVPLRSLGTPGLGVRVDLGEPVDVGSVVLSLATPGVTVEVLVRDELPLRSSTEVDWDLVGRAADAGAEVRLDVGPREARHWLIWFTDLREDDGAWQAGLNDITFEPVDVP